MRYQDFVIKDGKFVGKFEEMYQRFNAPWEQDDQERIEFAKSPNIAILNLQKYKIGSVIEVGSGLGSYTDAIHRKSGIRVLGLEISETAVEKARSRYPHLEFVTDSVSALPKYKAFEAILFAEVTWYILQDLQKSFQDMLEHFPGKYFLQNLTFYKGDRQQYGREYFSNMEEFIQFCPLKLLEYTSSVTSDPNGVVGTSSIFKIEKK